VPNPALL
jgi:hypothetical protein